jgi:hypothetical protein
MIGIAAGTPPARVAEDWYRGGRWGRFAEGHWRGPDGGGWRMAGWPRPWRRTPALLVLLCHKMAILADPLAAWAAVEFSRHEPSDRY